MPAEEPRHLPVPPGLVEHVARVSHNAMRAITEASPDPHAWERVSEAGRDSWCAVARAGIAATLGRMIHEGWLVVRPGDAVPDAQTPRDQPPPDQQKEPHR